jgi:hypothetical protein
MKTIFESDNQVVKNLSSDLKWKLRGEIKFSIKIMKEIKGGNTKQLVESCNEIH